jgi:hypothetical protein
VRYCCCAVAEKITHTRNKGTGKKDFKNMNVNASRKRTGWRSRRERPWRRRSGDTHTTMNP